MYANLKIMLIKSNDKHNGKWMLKAEYFDVFSKAGMERLNFLEICVGWCKCEFIFSKTHGVKFV